MHLANTIVESIDALLATLPPGERTLDGHEARIARDPRSGDGARFWGHSAAMALREPVCGRFEIGADVLEAARRVLASKASSLLPALRLARAPHRWTWLEWPVEDGGDGVVRQGWLLTEMEGEGSNLAVPFVGYRGGGFALRPYVGSLLWRGAEEETVDPAAAGMEESVARLKAQAGSAEEWRQAAEALVRQGMPQDIVNEESIRRAQREAMAMAPQDLVAELRIDARIRLGVLDERGRARPDTSRTGTQAYREFRELIAVLLLLNSRNAVSVGDEPDLGKLNKARAKRRKGALVPLRPVILDLSRRLRAARRAGLPNDLAAIRATIVRGHFKVRRTGVFWWSPHVRGAGGGLPPGRDYAVRNPPETPPTG